MSEDIKRVMTLPMVDVPLAGRVLGVSQNAAYRAVQDGSIPAVRVGGQWRVPTAKLREMLGLPVNPPAIAA